MFVSTNCCWRSDGRTRWKSRVIWKHFILDIVHSLLFSVSTRTFLLELILLFYQRCLGPFWKLHHRRRLWNFGFAYWLFFARNKSSHYEVYSLTGKFSRIVTTTKAQFYGKLFQAFSWLTEQSHTTCGLLCRRDLFCAGGKLFISAITMLRKKIPTLVGCGDLKVERRSGIFATTIYLIYNNVTPSPQHWLNFHVESSQR